MRSASGARMPRHCSRALSPTEAWPGRHGLPSHLRRPRAQLNPLGALAACLPQAHRRPAGFLVGNPHLGQQSAVPGQPGSGFGSAPRRGSGYARAAWTPPDLAFLLHDAYNNNTAHHV